MTSVTRDWDGMGWWNSPLFSVIEGGVVGKLILARLELGTEAVWFIPNHIQRLHFSKPHSQGPLNRLPKSRDPGLVWCFPPHPPLPAILPCLWVLIPP